MPEVDSLETVYYDTAAQPLLYRPRVYQGLKAMGALDRVVLGSDYPLLRCGRYVQDLMESGLQNDDIDKVASGNALSFLARFFSRPNEGN